MDRGRGGAQHEERLEESLENVRRVGGSGKGGVEVDVVETNRSH